MSMSPKERMVANEVIFKQVNTSIQKFLQKEPGPVKKIDFYCECSNPDCLERISLTPKEYQKLHDSEKRFVLKSGHEYLEVEKVVDKKDGFEVVEKHFKPPKPAQINSSLKRISTESAL